MITIESEHPDNDPNAPTYRVVCDDDAEADAFDRQVREAGGIVTARWEMTESEVYAHNVSVHAPHGY